MMGAFRNSMTKLLYSLLGVMIFVGGLGGGLAQAETTTTTYPGTMCQPYNPTASDNIRYSSQGVYNNSSTQSATVYCPVPYTLSGGQLSYVIVDVKDQSSSATIYCTAYIRGLNGKYVYSKSGNSDEFFGGNSDVFISGITYSDGGGIYNVSCNLPKKVSGVPSFSVVSYSAFETK